jgi:hypothetical protein
VTLCHVGGPAPSQCNDRRFQALSQLLKEIVSADDDRVGDMGQPLAASRDGVQVCCLALNDGRACGGCVQPWMMRQILPLTPTLLSFQTQHARPVMRLHV